MSEEEFYRQLAEVGFPLSNIQKEQFATYYELLVEWNQKMNLTAITRKNDVYLKHFFDSLAPIFQGVLQNEKKHLLDIGAGAGFPSFPLKILYPDLRITIIDSLNKRINFLSNLTQALNFDDITLLHGRAEDFGQDSHYRASFDWVTARAVARLNTLAELTLPFLKKGGICLALKATNFESELEEAKHAISILGGKFLRSSHYELPDSAERHLALLEKIKDTPKRYPRKPSLPSKKPL